MRKTFMEAIEAKLRGEKGENLSGKQLMECVGEKWAGKKDKMAGAVDAMREMASIYEADAHAKKFMDALDEATSKICEVMLDEAYDPKDKNLISIIASSKKIDGEVVDEKKDEKEEEEKEEKGEEEEVDETRVTGSEDDYLSRLKAVAQKRKANLEEGKKKGEEEEEEEEEELEEDTGLQRFQDRKAQQMTSKDESKKEEEEEEEEVEEDTGLERFWKKPSQVATGKGGQKSLEEKKGEEEEEEEEGKEKIDEATELQNVLKIVGGMDKLKKIVSDYDLSEPVYVKLLDHFSSNGEMPQDIAQGDKGDPVEWILNKLASLSKGKSVKEDTPFQRFQARKAQMLKTEKKGEGEEEEEEKEEVDEKKSEEDDINLQAMKDAKKKKDVDEKKGEEEEEEEESEEELEEKKNFEKKLDKIEENIIRRATQMVV